MGRDSFGRSLGAAFCVSLVLASCGGSDETTPPGGGGGPAPIAAAVAAKCAAQRGGTPVNLETIAVSLGGEFEVPPVATTAVGTGSFTVDRTTGALTGSITVTGTATPVFAAHIHTGFAGKNGPITVTLNADPLVTGRYNVPPAMILDPADPVGGPLATFLAGGMYVNAHTNAVGTGELRGQIVPGGIDVVRCVASGDFEVPALTTPASGIAYTTVNAGTAANPGTGAVVANVRTAGFTDANAAHLHLGFAGEIGPIALGLNKSATEADLWENTGTLTAGPTGQLAAYMAGGIYVNVHTPGSGTGLIRSQIVPTDILVFRFGLSGAQEVPAVATSATAVGYVTVNDANGAVAVNARTSGLLNPTNAHIHQGAAGVIGPSIVNLSRPNAVGEPEFWTGTGTFSVAQLNAFKADQMYVNVHTPAYPDGEIRGQIVLP